MLEKTSILDKYSFFELSYQQRIFTVLNIYNNKYFLSTKSAYYSEFWRQ